MPNKNCQISDFDITNEQAALVFNFSRSIAELTKSTYTLKLGQNFDEFLVTNASHFVTLSTQRSKNDTDCDSKCHKEAHLMRFAA
jgi:hypothetical protein